MKVKCISVGNNRYLTLHKIYNVLNSYGYTHEIVNDVGYAMHYESRLFEPVEEEDMTYNGVDGNGKPYNFTDADLKEGMVVKLRSGEAGMISVSCEEPAVSFFYKTLEGCWLSQVSLKNGRDSKWDIIEVYRKREPYRFFDKTLEHDILVWKANPTLTEQEKRIQELQATIAKAQEQIQELKGALK